MSNLIQLLVSVMSHCSQTFSVDFMEFSLKRQHLRSNYASLIRFICRKPQIFQTMNSLKLNNLSMKYQRFTPTGCKDIEMRKFLSTLVLVIKQPWLVQCPERL